MTPLEGRVRLWHILEAGEKLIEYTAGTTYDEYTTDRKTVSAVKYEFTIIGEALNRLLNEEPGLEPRLTGARQIVGFRNKLVHDYPDIDLRRVWRIIEHHLPLLLAEVRALLAESDAAP